MASISRQFTDGDMTGLMKLFRKVIPGKELLYNQNRLEWLFRTNPCIPETGVPIWVCDNRGEIGACACVLMTRIKLIDKELVAGWLVIVYRDPNYLGGLSLVRLSGLIRKQTGIMLGLGLTDEVFKIAKAFNWYYLGNVPVFIKYFSSRSILEKFVKYRIIGSLFRPLADFILRTIKTTPEPPPDPELDIKMVNSFGTEIDELWETVRSMFPVIVVRDSSYLNWKYVQQPGMNYKLFLFTRKGQPVGYSVIRTTIEDGCQTGLLVDFLSAPTDFRYLVHHAVEYLADENVERIKCSASFGPAKKSLKEMGFTHRETDMRLVFSVSGYDGDHANLQDSEKWFVTRGDSDADRIIY